MEEDLPSLPKRIAYLVTILGGFWLLLMGFIWLVSKAPEYPAKRLARGDSIKVEVQFNGPALDAKGASIFVPEKTFLNRNWEGRRFVAKDQEKGVFEIILDGKSEGIELSLGKTEIGTAFGRGEIEIRAPETAPAGRYRVWLKGVYEDVTRITLAPRLVVLRRNSELKGIEIPTVVVDVE